MSTVDGGFFLTAVVLVYVSSVRKLPLALLYPLTLWLSTPLTAVLLPY
jgi:hypothetical protein